MERFLIVREPFSEVSTSRLGAEARAAWLASTDTERLRYGVAKMLCTFQASPRPVVREDEGQEEVEACVSWLHSTDKERITPESRTRYFVSVPRSHLRVCDSIDDAVKEVLEYASEKPTIRITHSEAEECEVMNQHDGVRWTPPSGTG